MGSPLTGRGSAGGKLILCGEHAVVYGHPAIALGVDRGTRVTMREVDGALRVVDADGHALDDPRLREAVATLIPEGWEVRVSSELPIGRGMGSSAALAVALVRAEADARGLTLTAEGVHERAFAVERKFHGNPSGIDHAVAARGGVVRYRRTLEGPEITPLPVPDWALVVLDSGEEGNTAALVAGVGARRPGIDPLLDRIGEVVTEAEKHLHDPVAVGRLLLENHALLVAIGVSTPRLNDLVAAAVQCGATGAKLAGAGGGGVVIALTADPAPVLAALRARGLHGFVCRPSPARAEA